MRLHKRFPDPVSTGQCPLPSVSGELAPFTSEPRLILQNQLHTGTLSSVSRPGSPGRRSWKLECFQGKQALLFQAHAGRCLCVLGHAKRPRDNLMCLQKCEVPVPPYPASGVWTSFLNKAQTATLSIKQEEQANLKQTSTSSGLGI